MASAQPVINAGPPMKEVKNIFFKAHPTISYFSTDSEADSVDNDAAFKFFNRGLECSNVYGCLFVSYNKSLYLIRVIDLLSVQKDSNLDNSRPIQFKNVKKLEIRNDALPVSPNIISLSNGEDFVAFDTVRGDSAWVIVFKLSDFVMQPNSCRPLCEVRCSSNLTSRISCISWNPGENLNTMFAINVDDGSLFLAKLLGPNNVELNRFANGGVRCLCWSPKGKQLVIGRTNGNLSQLKLDLTEAKQIPKPEPESVPISILWTQTTQFLIVFHKESFIGIDFMQLDLPKNAPPIYTNNGDVFVSDTVPNKSTCYFVPFVPWNTILAMTNSASDVVVMVKDSVNADIWTPGDVSDNRRAAFLLDNYSCGATVFNGYENPVVFSEVESYPSMPILFILSQRGYISTFSVVNSDAQAPSLSVKVKASVPESIFSLNAATESTFGYSTVPQPQTTLFQTPQSQPVISKAPAAPTQQPFMQFSIPGGGDASSKSFIQPQPPSFTSGGLSSDSPSLNLLPKSDVLAQSQAAQKSGSIGQQADPRQLATSTLPTAKDMAILQQAVEEKRREMTTHLQRDAQRLKGFEEDNQCAFVVSEIRKFEQRLHDFKTKLASRRADVNETLNFSYAAFEKNVLTNLHVVEDFVSDMVLTTKAQKEEVEVLKEKILNHFSQLEYAKSLEERSKDPRYLEHIRTRPLDPVSRQKFQELAKLHNYVKNQVSECRRYYYEQNRKKDSYDRVTPTQLIYLTLANHSQIIRRLTSEMDKLKSQLGLGKHVAVFDEPDYLPVCDSSYSGVDIKRSSSSKPFDDPDEITLTDLTAGISKVKLNRHSDRVDKKPIRFSNRKLLMLSKCMSDVSVLKVKADEAPWTRTPSKSTRPKPIAYPTASFENTFSKLLEAPSKPEQIQAMMGAFETKTVSTDISTHLPTASLKPVSVKPTSSLLGETAAPGRLASVRPTVVSNPGALFATGGTKMSDTVAKTNQNTSPFSTSSTTASTAPAGFVKAKSDEASGQLTTGKSVSNVAPSASGGSPFGFSSMNTTIKKEISSSPSSISVQPQPIGISVKTDTSSTIDSSTMKAFMGAGTNSSGSPSAQLPILSSLLSSPQVPSYSTVPTTPSTVPTTKTSTGLFSSPTSSASSIFGSRPFTFGGQLGSGVTVTPVKASSGDNSASKPAAGLTITPVGSAVLPTSGSGTVSSASPFGFSSISGTAGKNIFGTAPTTPVVLPTAKSLTISSGTTPPVQSTEPASLLSEMLTSKPAPIQSSISGVSTVPNDPVNLTTDSSKISKPTDLSVPQIAAVSSLPATSGPSVISAVPSSMPTIPTSKASSSPLGGFSFATLPTSVAPSPGLFSSVSSSGGIFSSAKPAVSTPGLFGSTTQSSPATGLFTLPPSSSSNVFSSTATPPSTGGPFSNTGTGLFTASGTPSTVPSSQSAATGFMSSLSISDPAKSAVPPSTTPSNIFSAPAFGNPATTTASIFGGGGAPLFGSATTTSSFASTASNQVTTNAFGAPTTQSSSVFGGSASFGSSSPFGSSFGSGNSVFGASATNSNTVFGGAATTTNQPSTFGSITQGGLASTFGSSPFGGGAQQTASVFGGSPQKPTGGLFSSPAPAFGNAASPPGGSVFGGGGSVFGGTTGATGAFSSSTASGGVAQQGFGFAQAKPESGFGSPPPQQQASPVFGGGATFGSTSPFGSSFQLGSAASPTSFGSSNPAATGGSIFGGGANQSSGFGSLAQQGSSGFGSPSGGFGTVAPQPQPSIFGSPTQAKPVFGGQAFSSWR